ncbi:Uncharacterized protein OBRU01_12192 [Operophtera brumata]|uniref:Uncharacterized protein n=1 Tax=Operophtera brumata TaxID=104452 RepID=A0A0L7LB61_OPEBR|nr:Uncharacterized protein OBRU01_12192 [Operophtera brumata]
MYKDAPELSTTLRRSSSEFDLAEEKTLLVNPDCPVRIMLEYIRKKCNLGVFTNFDLCDENGSLMGLFNMDTYAYATDLRYLSGERSSENTSQSTATPPLKKKK